MNVFKRTAKTPESNRLHALVRITELAKTLAAIDDFEEILRLSRYEAKQLFAAHEAFLLMMNPQTNETVRMIQGKGKSSKAEKDKHIQYSVNYWIYQNRKPFFCRDAKDDERLRKQVTHTHDAQSIIASALEAEGQFLGSLMLVNRLNGPVFSKQDLDLLERFVCVISPHLRNSQKIKEYFAHVDDEGLLKKYNEAGLKGRSETIRKLVKQIDTAAKSVSTVFIEGATGTGKEVVAELIHKFSDRGKAPFTPIDFSTIPENLLESTLFGHKKGAFTGAEEDWEGLLAASNNGVVFLDEVQNIPLAQQAKLLRFLESREIRPVGGTKTTQVNVRIIAASQTSLQELVNGGKFREDLMYRLLVYHFRIPSLAERREDIRMLAYHFLDISPEAQKKNASKFAQDVITFLREYPWEGNIRELRNFVERLAAKLPENVNIIRRANLPQDFKEAFDAFQRQKTKEESLASLAEVVAKAEAPHIEKALIRHNWNRSRASVALGVTEGTIRNKMAKYGIGKS